MAGNFHADLGTAPVSLSPVRVRLELPAKAATRLSYGLLLLFLLLLYSQVALLFPALEPLRPMLLVALAALAVLVVELTLSGRAFALVGPESHLLLVLLAGACVSSLTAIWMRQAAEATVELAKMTAIYFLMLNTIDSKKRLRGVFWCLAIGGLIPSFMTLRTYASGVLQDEGRAAWVGIFGNPNELAYGLVILIPLAISAASAQRFAVRVLSWGMTAVYLAAIFVSYSRGGFLGLLVVLALIGWRSRSLWFRLLMLVGLAAAFVYVSAYWTRSSDFSNLNQDLSVQQRIATIHAGIEMFCDRPLLGVGPGCFVVAWPLYAPKDLYTRGWLVNHNTFFQVLSETGLAGTIPFVLLIGAALFHARRIARRTA
ncbi:MAG: hypothetical protein DMG07_15295, partial [Acidobacteria bacterium]